MAAGMDIGPLLVSCSLGIGNCGRCQLRQHVLQMNLGGLEAESYSKTVE